MPSCYPNCNYPAFPETFLFSQENWSKNTLLYRQNFITPLQLKVDPLGWEMKVYACMANLGQKFALLIMTSFSRGVQVVGKRMKLLLFQKLFYGEPIYDTHQLEPNGSLTIEDHTYVYLGHFMNIESSIKE